jgi:hypothetical protein
MRSTARIAGQYSGKPVTDPALILLTAAILSASAIGVFAFQVQRLDPSGPERLIGELRLSQWLSVLLAATGAVPIGMALFAHPGPIGNIDLTEGVAFVILAGVVLQCEPRTALRIVVAGFVAHALTDIAHRPGWLSMQVLPQSYAAGCASYDVALAALCFWAMRR